MAKNPTSQVDIEPAYVPVGVTIRPKSNGSKDEIAILWDGDTTSAPMLKIDHDGEPRYISEEALLWLRDHGIPAYFKRLAEVERAMKAK